MFKKLEMERKVPKIDTAIAGANPPEEGKNYLISDAELTTTDIRSYTAVRVTLKEVGKGKPYKLAKEDGEPIEKVTMLWVREQVGAKSKMGCFLSAFRDFFAGGEHENDFNDTDYWKGHHIHVLAWKEREREIKVLD